MFLWLPHDSWGPRGASQLLAQLSAELPSLQVFTVIRLSI